MTALPKPAYVMSEPHLSGWRVVLGYETLADAQAAQSAVSAPEARSGEPVEWRWRIEGVDGWRRCGAAKPHFAASQPGNVVDLQALYTHPAAPSADKLRIAVEALELTKSRIQTWPIDDQETCMCGSPVAGHGMGDGHSPVSQGDHAVSMLVEEIDQALAVLKAEGAK